MSKTSAKADGNVSATTCPHDCANCREIEVSKAAGFGGRPLTVRERMRHGLITYPSREGRVEWSAETIEARLADDLARVEFERARDEWVRAQVALEETERQFSDHTGDHVRRRLEAQAVFNEAEREVDGAEARYQEAARRAMELGRRDSEQHRQAQLRESYERAEAEKLQRSAGGSMRRRRLLIGRLTG